MTHDGCNPFLKCFSGDRFVSVVLLAQIAINLYTKATKSQYLEVCHFYQMILEIANYLLLIYINVLCIHKPCTVIAVKQKVYIMLFFMLI